MKQQARKLWRETQQKLKYQKDGADYRAMMERRLEKVLRGEL